MTGGLTMWRLTYVREWLHGLADRLAVWWIQRPMERFERDLRQWMADNAQREDEP